MTCLEGVSEFHATLGDKTGQRKVPGTVEDGSFSTLLGTLPQCQWRTEMASCESRRGGRGSVLISGAGWSLMQDSLRSLFAVVKGSGWQGKLAGDFSPQSRT